MDFLWIGGTTPTPGEPLREDMHTEVCVIGGMAGVLCTARTHDRDHPRVL